MVTAANLTLKGAVGFLPIRSSKIMCTKTFFILAGLTSLIVARAQDARDLDLARQLASEYTQHDAAEAIGTSARDKLPVLLAWAKAAPIPLDDVQAMVFRAGLAEAFGALRAKEGIPFLLANLTLRRSPFTLPAFGSPEKVIDRLPAVAALIRIGPEALKSIIEAPYTPAELDTRLARIVVVSRIAATVQDRAKAIQYLRNLASEARIQSSWAGDALHFVGAQ